MEGHQLQEEPQVKVEPSGAALQTGISPAAQVMLIAVGKLHLSEIDGRMFVDYTSRW